ncbi:SCP-like extracellular [Streptomyces venezuelae]|uniref:SCP-like extracellular n=1 Tax=Streptomyces venezuelae TaxID=54571 RepID=A0A5P2DP74_STRVZ|nr:CAP domain-containing protein [Streptomyces venezuelae]QES56876.1 SCP-like extracellular [Streptomyces venezuelae]
MGRHRLPAPPHGGGKRGTALRTGLLGVSVAVALGTAAVTTGMVPVGGSFPYVGVSGTDAPTTEAGAGASTGPGTALQQQNGLANLSGRASAGTGAGSASPKAPAPASPSASASPSGSAGVSPSASAPPSSSPSPSATPTPAAKTPAAKTPSTEAPTPESSRTTAAAPVTPTAPAPATTRAPAPAPSKSATPAPRPPLDGHSAEEAAVVDLVNQERALAGCGPVRANPPLATLAGAFSLDMATRGFFGHEDPEGNSPWDRAAKAGISGLGGENIARGQGDAEAVMKAWMNSPDHKANILNCEFRTLGVGVHVAAGGPWWTQDFGF